MDDREAKSEFETEFTAEAEAEGEDTFDKAETGADDNPVFEVGFTKEFMALIDRIGGIEIFGAWLEAEAVRRGYTEGVGAGGGARRSVDTSRLSPYEKILFGLGKQ